MPASRKPPAYYYFVFFLLFAIPLLFLHLPLLTLPFFWDEHGQFIPTALDLLRDGAWVAHSTVPNIHPPEVEAYLVLWYKLFGYSIPLTRFAMLVLAGVGLLATFLLAVELSRGTPGAPAFLPPILLLASPLFYMQSMMAQLDMPAMVFTMVALLFFVQKKYDWAAAASVMLVLAKETGLVVPLVFFLWLAWRRDFRHAAFFIAPALALGSWLLILHHATHFWFGNPEFEHYNIGYSVHPVRVALSLGRRIYYLFFAEFRWIGTLVLLLGGIGARAFQLEGWRIVLWVSAATFFLVTVLGGAELERYLLPVLPVFYIAVSIAIANLPRWAGALATAGLIAGLAANLFWNPPYPFPYENNLAMVDFVHLQQTGASYAERRLAGKTIATAWPYTAALANPDYGFVKKKLNVVETNDFHVSSIRALPQTFDALITYTRTWAPADGVIAVPIVRRFLHHFYEWEPDITAKQCSELGLEPAVSWEMKGQEITIYLRKRTTSDPAPSSVAVQRGVQEWSIRNRRSVQAREWNGEA